MYAPILETLRRIQQVERLQAALSAYTQATDAAAHALGLEHRRDLLAADGLPMPTRLDLGDVVALGQLEPSALEMLSVAAAVMHVTLDLPLYAASVKACIERVPALRPAAAWLVPSLLRWLHVRWYEILFGPFPGTEGASARVPPEGEDAAVRGAAGPRRRLADWTPSADDAWTLGFKVKAWWAIRIVGQTQGDVTRRWHATITTAEHRRKYADDPDAKECGCKRAVSRGVKEVSALL
jgi:hypothetical protein